MRKKYYNQLHWYYLYYSAESASKYELNIFQFIMSKLLDNNTTKTFINYNLVLFFKEGRRYYPVLLPH